MRSGKRLFQHNSETLVGAKIWNRTVHYFLLALSILKVILYGPKHLNLGAPKSRSDFFIERTRTLIAMCHVQVLPELCWGEDPTVSWQDKFTSQATQLHQCKHSSTKSINTSTATLHIKGISMAAIWAKFINHWWPCIQESAICNPLPCYMAKHGWHCTKNIDSSIIYICKSWIAHGKVNPCFIPLSHTLQPHHKF